MPRGSNQLDWPHAPSHRLPSAGGTYMITSSTYKKVRHLHSPDRLDLVLTTLMDEAKAHGWQLEAWAILANHYHFVANSAQPDTLPAFTKRLHSATALRLNRLDSTPGRRVWYNYWESIITYDASYFARLNYVHQNPVKHGLVAAASQYRWCSASWFERQSTPAQITKIYRFKTDKLNVYDDF